MLVSNCDTVHLIEEICTSAPSLPFLRIRPPVYQRSKDPTKKRTNTGRCSRTPRPTVPGPMHLAPGATAHNLHRRSRRDGLIPRGAAGLTSTSYIMYRRKIHFGTRKPICDIIHSDPVCAISLHLIQFMTDAETYARSVSAIHICVHWCAPGPRKFYACACAVRGRRLCFQ